MSPRTSLGDQIAALQDNWIVGKVNGIDDIMPILVSKPVFVDDLATKCCYLWMPTYIDQQAKL